MTKYIYNNIDAEPNLEYIHEQVALSSMVNKNIQYCRWDEDVEQLQVLFDVDLVEADKAILDTIVEGSY